MTFRFGMREIGVKDRHYKLNGKSLWLRGSNLVFEWNWGDTITGHEMDYLVTEAREMSMNSFRTHTQPPPRLWCDICDEHGTMILAEFPVLYNYQDYKFTPEEYEIWHRNVLTRRGRLDGPALEPSLGHHVGPVQRIARRQRLGGRAVPGLRQRARSHAARPCARAPPAPRRTTTSTPAATSRKPMKAISSRQIAGWFKEAGQRTTTVTEYMNYFGHPRTQWTGVDDRSPNDLAVAQIGAEHTEAMRRARLDGILPYMYAGWTRTRQAARVRETGKGSAVWKADYAAPQSAAWHSSLSPVLASLDLFDAGLPDRPGGHHRPAPHQRFLARRQSPRRSAADPRMPRVHSRGRVLRQPGQQVELRFRPEGGFHREGSRHLEAAGRGRLLLADGSHDRRGRAARCSASASCAPSSRRSCPTRLKQRTFVVLGSSEAARAFFKSKGLRTSDRSTSCRRTRTWSSSGTPRT